MKKIIFFSLLCVFISSCVKTNHPKELVFENLKIEKKIFASNDSTLPYMLLNLEFTYPTSCINDTILQRVQKEFVINFAGEEYIGRSPIGAFEALDKSLTEESLALANELAKDMPDFSEYYQIIKSEVIDTTKNVITVKTMNENYLGGAHGSHTIKYCNINTQTGNRITDKDLFGGNVETKLPQLILDGLSLKYGTSIKDIIFDLDAIQSNNNFYFSDKGIVYVFNEYEIGPYSEGTIEVLLPTEKIKDIISEQYKEKIG